MCAPMDINRFWSLVEQIDWATRSKGSTDEGKRFVLGLLSQEEAEAFRDQMQALESDLSRRFDAYAAEKGVQYGLGDDSWSDMLSHIIGLGREEYEANLAHPSLALARANAGDYRESFHYIIPWGDDYEVDKLPHFMEWAGGLVEEYTSVQELPVSDEVKKKAARLATLLTPMAGGDVEAFKRTEEEGRALAKEIVQMMAPLRGGMGLVGVLGNEWAVLNLYSDVRKWELDRAVLTGNAA